MHFILMFQGFPISVGGWLVGWLVSFGLFDWSSSSTWSSWSALSRLYQVNTDSAATCLYHLSACLSVHSLIYLSELFTHTTGAFVYLLANQQTARLCVCPPVALLDPVLYLNSIKFIVLNCTKKCIAELVIYLICDFLLHSAFCSFMSSLSLRLSS